MDGGVDAGTFTSIRPWPPDRPAYVNPIPAENALSGDPGWHDFSQNADNGEIEGYADHVSAAASDVVSVSVSADSPHMARYELVRLGWYGGAGARRVASGGPFAVAPQSACPMDPGTGLIRCHWTPSFSFNVDGSFVSGLYLIRLIRDDGFGRFVPLVITDSRPADLLLQSAVLTAEAYNAWGGESLYTDGSRSLPWSHAVEVSFDRPYTEGTGAGEVTRYEVDFARFLEKNGYDVSYTTNLDVAAGGAPMLAQTGAFLSVGHDEYWSKAERDALEGARDAGVPLLFFSGNTGYWQLRLEDDAGAGPRVVIGWKEFAYQDPDQGPEVTARFRDLQIGRPENSLLGIMFGTWSNIRSPFEVYDASHWLFAGTGLSDGDVIPWLVGYESDTRYANGAEPPGLEVAAQEPTVAIDGYTRTSCATSYRAQSGALVFDAGTIEWAWGLAPTAVADPRVERMTANVLHEALGLPIAPGVGTGKVSGPEINGSFARDVTTVVSGLGDLTSVVALSDGTLAVAEADHNQILQITPGSPAGVSVIAGTGVSGAAGWEVPTAGDQAQFRQPTALLALPSGDLIVSDTGNHCLRDIAPDINRTVRTIAGSCGEASFADGVGLASRFNAPMGLTLAPGGQALLVADAWNFKIRQVALSDWSTTTILDLTSPRYMTEDLFGFPSDLTTDPSGNVYVIVGQGLSLLRLDALSADLDVIAGGDEGGDDGSVESASLGPVMGLAWQMGSLVFSDAANGRIRLVSQDSNGHWRVSTIAGGVRAGNQDGSGDRATFSMPMGLTVDASGAFLVADMGNGAVRKITP
jgi:hypothetical protein